ncbi:outer dense fiber protein 3-like protein 2 [Drosophila teissieri]|uniref:outer dense fiber protein 3-like protein 2 n=1 Tax=Drosophila teissieri TaxID=7243 RepID=UPI001CBA4F4B|nr:outer dense fiber protein 3-like protein 2 [Drosophila teissieri]
MSCNRSFGPGPGAYNLPSTFGFKNCDNRMQRSPQFSFGRSSRACNSSRKVETGPGPAAYHLGKTTRFGRPAAEEYTVYRRR